ncbi:MAG: hypothetical protein AAB071_01325 [Bacteroidota bacterium]
MKNFFKIGMLLFVFGILFATYTYTQHHFRGRGENGRGNQCGNCGQHGMMKMYDTESEETISGKIVHIETTQHGAGVHLQVQTNSDTISVRVGPSWYLDEQNVSFKENETVKITGSKITNDDETFIIASTIKTSDDKITLRNDEGFPLWRGYGRRHRW